MKKVITLRLQLFFSYSMLFILAWAVFVVSVYIYFFLQIKRQVIDRQEQICSTTESALLSKISICDTLAMNILYSNLVRSYFEEQITLYHQYSTGQLTNEDLLYMNASECSDILSNIVGMTEDIAQVNLYDLSGNVIGYGLCNGKISGDLENVVWLRPTDYLQGHKYLSFPHTMSWMNVDTFYSSGKYISLTRSFKNRSFEQIGYIEIVQDCQDFFEYLDHMILKESDLSIYVFNNNHECIYPYTATDDSRLLSYSDILQSAPEHLSMQTLEEGSQLISVYQSGSEDITIFVAQPTDIIVSAIGGFNKFFSVLAITFLGFLLLLSFALSNRVARPLKKLCTAIQKISLPVLTIQENSLSLPNGNTIKEISDLISSFNNMYDTLSHTAKELLFAKSEEINSKILAVQAQMNPHFLYNNLSNIAIMAEENMNEQIIQTCQDITFMLRYIAVQTSAGVELSREIDYTIRYENCMKIRYENDLIIKIDIPEEMLTFIVPKLILQPLVENSIKYGLSSNPPWTISIVGRILESGWNITVSDDGPGFSQEILSSLSQEIEKFDRTAQIPQLSINGMGLLNIYIRLKLLYKENTYFEIINLANGGASVSLGYLETRKRRQQ